MALSLVPQPPPAAPPAINTQLLASACSGYVAGLNILLNGVHAAGELELSFDLRAEYNTIDLTPELLLKGVTLEGDTALHAVAASGDGDNFLRSADIVCIKADHLLFSKNNRGDTPLHLAARAGKFKMVYRLIALAKGIVGGTGPAIANGAARVNKLVKMENELKETVLHEAVRTGNDDMVSLLMGENSELANFPKEGTSPLYLAILLWNKTIAETLHGMSGGILSYSGPNGQNALHAAARHGPDLTEMLLRWNKKLSTKKDENGSTPLHFAAGLLWPAKACSRILEADPAALYQADHDGLFPIHVAASAGANLTVAMFLKKSPGSAGLVDAKGRTFLHVSVEKKVTRVVNFASRYQPVSWILNMRDKDGNTALHLAVEQGSLRTVCALLRNLKVEINLTNEKGHTPLDISRYKISRGVHHTLSSRAFILRTLQQVGARSGSSRQDQFNKNYEDNKETEIIKEAAQSLCVGSVLIATVTFGATFALPGGYRADDHENGGTPTRAGRYSFDAFIVANTFSFVCSTIATMGFMFSGSSVIDVMSRKFYLVTSVYLLQTSISTLVAAFALGVYLVLAPVALKTAIVICVLSSLVVLFAEVEFWVRMFFALSPLVERNGLPSAIVNIFALAVHRAVVAFWPIIFTFAWAGQRAALVFYPMMYIFGWVAIAMAPPGWWDWLIEGLKNVVK